jgi:hypothetical protein
VFRVSQEWPDVCNTATVTVTVKPQVPTFQARSSGIATAYLVRWAGRDAHDCAQLQPNVTLSCGLDGEVSLLDVEGSNNELCSRQVDNTTGFPDMNRLTCLPRNSGELYVECRDVQETNSTRRQITVNMHSEAVSCTQLDSTFQAVWLNTFCNVTMDPATSIWQNRGIDCSGPTTPDGTGETLCYEYALGLIAQPADVIMSSANYEMCSLGRMNFRSLAEAPSYAPPRQSDRRLRIEDVLTHDPSSPYISTGNGNPSLRGSVDVFSVFE